MDRYLGKMIPEILDKNYWTDSRFECALAYIKDCEKDAWKKIENGKVLTKKDKNVSAEGKKVDKS